tara:strand:- start:2713 stop:3918 length:1206 start_codon:yes stop_codon:yes gene_type:complete
MKNIFDKKILLIISGGVSAYKSLELIRLLKKNGSEIKVILTKSAKKFITPLSITSLTQNKVYEDLFDHNSEAEMDHISLSRWSDLVLICPATANTMSKLSYGKADDLASTVVLASDKNIILVPAMNVRMWSHKATQQNLLKLQDFGYEFIGPQVGEMACGEFGEGKMSEPIEIINYLNNFFSKKKTNIKKQLSALVTAGPTNEYIDPVRFITNRSSGKQGFEIAKSLVKRGIETTLIAGPTNLQDPKNIKVIRVETALEMFEEVKKNLPSNIAICTAAVSDFKITNYQQNKIKKNQNVNLDLEKNVDILNYLSNHNSLRPNLVIGFAAETENVIENAKKKIKEKHCDWIIANDVSKKDIGFNSNFNEVSIINNNKIDFLSKKTKSDIAEKIVDKIIHNFNN